MKVLFDQGTPLPLRNHLSHSIDTVAELGWSALESELLDRPESRGFDCHGHDRSELLVAVHAQEDGQGKLARPASAVSPSKAVG